MKELFLDRELSWLAFDHRVLEEAARPEVPLCERLRFLSIFQQNLDEFSMTRIGTLLRRKQDTPQRRDCRTGKTAAEQLADLYEYMRDLCRRKQKIWEMLCAALLQEQIAICKIADPSISEAEALKSVLREQYADRFHNPVPLSELQPKSGGLYAGIITPDLRCYAVSCQRQSLMPLHGKPGAYGLEEDLLLAMLPTLFPQNWKGTTFLFRVTGNAELSAESQENLAGLEPLAWTKAYLQLRETAAPVRLQYRGQLTGAQQQRICGQLDMEPSAVFSESMPLDQTYLSELSALLQNRPSLRYSNHTPVTDRVLQKEQSIFTQIEARDRLLFCPYDSFEPILWLLSEAADDPLVTEIQMSAYRLAKNSRVMELLLRATSNGKRVRVLMELRARFDEANNLHWAEVLQTGGCTVCFGLPEYKVHGKLCVITRKTADKEQRYTVLSTGNYNEDTASVYTDLHLFTADPLIGSDASLLMEHLCNGQLLPPMDHLLTAPQQLRQLLCDCIEQQITAAKSGKPAYIGLKVNALTDRKIMKKLIRASQAGVKVDLAVRGICCLRPGVEGKTEHIRAVSVIGRFLEHTRIYVFGTGTEQTVYLSSADLMTRNTRRRVEIAVPIRNKTLADQIASIAAYAMADQQQAWELQSDGTYVRAAKVDAPFSSQEFFLRKFHQN